MQLILITGAAKIIKRLKEIEKRSEKKLTFFKTVGIYFHQKMEKVFKNQGAHDQSKWKAFSPKTLTTPKGTPRIRYYTSHTPIKGTHPAFLKSGVVRYSSNSKLLQAQGELRSSFRTLEVSNKFIKFGSDLPYAQAHQEGKGRLPKRRMLWISKNDNENILKKWSFFEKYA